MNNLLKDCKYAVEFIQNKQDVVLKGCLVDFNTCNLSVGDVSRLNVFFLIDF